MSSPELALPQETPLSSELDLPSDRRILSYLMRTSCGLGARLSSIPNRCLPRRKQNNPQKPQLPARTQDNPSRDPETSQPSGSKRSRQKPNSKFLGRSRLTIRQDDSSPGTLTLQQGKRPTALSENVKDLKEGVTLRTGRFWKAGGGTWEQNQYHDNENQHFALMES